jgi:hypothetical protein
MLLQYYYYRMYGQVKLKKVCRDRPSIILAQMLGEPTTTTSAPESSVSAVTRCVNYLQNTKELSMRLGAVDSTNKTFSVFWRALVLSRLMVSSRHDLGTLSERVCKWEADWLVKSVKRISYRMLIKPRLGPGLCCQDSPRERLLKMRRCQGACDGMASILTPTFLMINTLT